MSKVFLKDKILTLNFSDFPCLIFGAEKTGSSLFTVTLLSQLFQQGKKILFLSGYPMAKEEFMKQNENKKQDIILVKTIEEVQVNKNTQAILLEQADEDLFKHILTTLEDINERIILIKNFELYENSLFKSLSSKQNVIYSGNLDNWNGDQPALLNSIKTFILFSQPKNNTMQLALPENIEQYTGYLWGTSQKGLVKIKD